MIRKCTVLFLALLLMFGFLAAPASATLIALYDYGFNIDGFVSVPTLGDPIPAEVNVGAFDDVTGLGTITVTLSGAGMHYVGLFVDHEIDEAVNTYYNETGSTTGTPATGQTWEIDEPGWINGDIFENFQISTLDNGIGTSVYGDTTFPDDVSMAMGWDFSLAAGETGLVSFILNTSDMLPGFHLVQTDPDSTASPNTVYFSSTLEKKGVGVPEPATMLLLGSGLLGLAAFGRKRLK